MIQKYLVVLLLWVLYSLLLSVGYYKYFLSRYAAIFAMANSITSEQDAVLELQCFDALFEDLVNDVLCSKVIKSHETKMANNWFKEVCFQYFLSDCNF